MPLFRHKSRRTPTPRAQTPNLRPIRETDNMETPLLDSPPLVESPPVADSPPIEEDPVELALAESETFTLQDLRLGGNPVANIVVRGTIRSFAIEFFVVPGERRSRSHIVVELDEKITFRDSQGNVQDIIGLAMWMKLTPLGLYGELHVRYIIASRPFVEPVARFTFPLIHDDKPATEHPNTVDLINVLHGSWDDLPSKHRTCLALHVFRRRGDLVLGHRDTMIQWMKRLNMAGLVGWHYRRQEIKNVEYVGHDPIPGHHYACDMKRDEWGWLTVFVRKSPVSRGIWPACVERFTRHAGIVLPFVEESQDVITAEDFRAAIPFFCPDGI